MRHSTKIILLLASLLVITVVYTSCRKDMVHPEYLVTESEMTPYRIIYPPHFPEVQPIPEDNKMYLERVQLGKQLFFDSRLSHNGESCNTCHKPEYGFSLPGTSVFDKGLTILPLENLAWYKRFMWNGRLNGSVEGVMESELTVRFNTDIQALNSIKSYQEQFRKYYGATTITKELVAKALAQYMRALVSNDSKYDKFLRGEAILTYDEQQGMNMFFTEKADCFHCHVIVVFTDYQLHNNGLDSAYAKEIDKGFYNISGNTDDLGMFRTPNLRNVALRTEYMHDGRFKTLEEVIEFYDHQVNLVSNVDPIMAKPAKSNGLQLTPIEKQQLIAFLHTLTDSTMITDPLFQEP